MLLSNGYRIFVGDDEKVLGIDNGDGFTTLWMYLMPLNCILKTKMVSFYVYFIPQTNGQA